jgi:uncharacterized protein YcfL
MLNMKKGLALVLAAATAFTFAPVANLGNAVQAEAATEITKDEGETTLTANGSDYIEYHIQYDKEPNSSPVRLAWDNDNLVTVEGKDFRNQTVSQSAINNQNGVLLNGTTVKVKANGADLAGDVHFTLYNTSGNVDKTWTVHIVNKTVDPKYTLTLADTNNVAGTTQSVTGNGKFAVKVMQKSEQTDSTKEAKLTFADTNTPKRSWTQITGYSLSGTSVEVSTKPTDAAVAGSSHVQYKDLTLRFVSVGTSTLTVYMKDSNGKSQSYELVIDVTAEKSTMKIGNTEITANSNPNSDVITKTITLTGSDFSKAIGATLDNAQSATEKLTYTAYQVDKDGKAIYNSKGISGHTDNAAESVSALTTNHNASTDLTFSGDTVTATANALNAVEQYYDVLVTNNLSGANLKAAWVRVISIRNAKTFTTAEVKVDNQDVKATAQYNEDGTVGDGTTNAKLTLSTKDFADPEFTALANDSAMAAANITSSDPSVVEVSGNKLVAKKTGSSVVTFAAKSDTTHYGNATIKLAVTVTDKFIKAKIDAADITLTNAKKTDTIKATSTPATKYTYTPGNLVDGKWVEQTNPYVTVDKTTGKVTFNGNGYGSLKVRITGAPVTGVADAFVAKDITINYTNLKESALKVSTKTLSLKEGETGSIVASGASLGYASSDENVATVDSTGKVTAVAPGTAVITVSDAGNDTVAADQEAVIVTVKANYKNPAKVTGVKVSNKKGAKVTVKYTKDTTNPNVKYYVQKKVSGKTAGKSVGSTKTTLSVKKGATVKVRVKAYYYDTNGVKHVGAYSSWKTLKTDKK